MEKIYSRKFNYTSNCTLFILFAIILFVCYSNTFKATWQLDDKPNILKNHRIQITEITPSQLWQSTHASPGAGLLRRPIAYLSLALNWYFGKDNVVGYHIVNFTIHLSTAWVLFLTIKTLFATPRIRERYNPGSVLFISAMAALLWALNPIQTQAVTYIVQRMASLAALFALLSILYYLKARLSTTNKKRIIFAVIAGCLFIAALLSKENAATVILIAPVIELLFFQNTFSKAAVKRVLGGLFGGSIVVILLGIILRPELFDFILNYYNNRPFTLTERFLTEQRIVLFYLSQLFFPAPWRLSIEHDVVLSNTIFSPLTTIAAITVNVLLIAFALKISRKHPFISLAILFYYVNHLIESTIIPLELLYEHRNYLPSLFLFIPIGMFVNYLVSKYQKQSVLIVLITGITTLVLTLEGYATYERNKVWQTEESMWLDALEKAPNSARPLATLAIKLAWGPNPSEKKYRKALELTERTLSMRMGRKRLDAAQYGNMGSIYTKLGEYDKATFYYEKAIDLVPRDAHTRYNYAKTLLMVGAFSEARKQIEIILRNQYVHADYFYMIGFLYIQEGKPEKGLPAIRMAMKYAPGRPDILIALGKCFTMLGYTERANWFYARAKEKGGNDAILTLCRIENAIVGNNIQKGRKELRKAINIYSLPKLIYPLYSPQSARLRNVPLNRDLLIPFIRKELITTTSNMLQ